MHRCPSSKVRRSCLLCLLFTSGSKAKGKKAKASKKEKKGKEPAPKKKEKDAKNQEEKPVKGKKDKTKDRQIVKLDRSQMTSLNLHFGLAGLYLSSASEVVIPLYSFLDEVFLGN